MVFCIIVRLKFFLVDTKIDRCLYAILNFFHCMQLSNAEDFENVKCSSMLPVLSFSNPHPLVIYYVKKEFEKHFIFLTNVINSILFYSLLLVVESLSLAFLQTARDFSPPVSNLIQFQLGSKQLCKYTGKTI